MTMNIIDKHLEFLNPILDRMMNEAVDAFNKAVEDKEPTDTIVDLGYHMSVLQRFSNDLNNQ